MAATIAAPAARPVRSRSAAVRASAAPRGLLGLGGLRLTARGRVVVALLAALACAPLVGFGAQAFASSPGVPVEVRVHTVAPGETLWGFAQEIAGPREDVRDVVAHLRELNELGSAALQVGQTILVPVD
ncbi:LysM peptidoglycan-binding domain-containing protein [Puerhibacterium puerhi]|uniref:LysM peptidoglycan-binding domain-containing protein n=1 Tax=Puerhibacterium puerhi TaxID=2692623 RepID=UPI00135B8B2C|nr:LysM peptidoglycan-binding domain-containing protein [Puerhibacterium puerhi]